MGQPLSVRRPDGVAGRAAGFDTELAPSPPRWPMPDSVIPYLVVPAALAVFYYLIVLQPKWEKAAREKDDRILTGGREFVAYVQMANTKLYEATRGGEHSYAQVVYITDPDVPDLEEELARVAARLSEYRVQDPKDETDRLIGSVMESQVPYFRPLRLPPGGRRPDRVHRLPTGPLEPAEGAEADPAARPHPGVGHRDGRRGADGAGAGVQL